MLDVLSVGNANIDLMVNSDKLKGDLKPLIMTGGSACNFAVGCSRLGLSAGFLGFTGNDYFSKLIINSLKRERVKFFIKSVSNADTGFVVVFSKKYFKKYVKYSGANEFLVSLNLKPYFSKARHLHLATPPFELLKQLRPGLSVSLDPGASISKYSLNILRPYLSKVTIIVPNESEAKKITGHSFKQAAKDFLDAGIKIVIIKCGKKGVYVATKSERFFLKSIDFNVVDTTGAGDSFASAFVTAWFNGKGLLESARWGIISSNVCVTRLGAQNSARLSELSELYDKYY